MKLLDAIFKTTFARKFEEERRGEGGLEKRVQDCACGCACVPGGCVLVCVCTRVLGPYDCLCVSLCAYVCVCLCFCMCVYVCVFAREEPEVQTGSVLMIRAVGHFHSSNQLSIISRQTSSTSIKNGLRFLEASSSFPLFLIIYYTRSVVVVTVVSVIVLIFLLLSSIIIIFYIVIIVIILELST